MAVTYEDTLPTARDHVRLLISDTDTSSAEFSDEEIDALIAAETATGDALPYFAAARCLEILLARYSAKGKGIEEKQVSKLRIRYGVAAQSLSAALRDSIKDLRKRGAWLLAPKSGGRAFRVLR